MWIPLLIGLVSLLTALGLHLLIRHDRKRFSQQRQVTVDLKRSILPKSKPGKRRRDNGGSRRW